MSACTSNLPYGAQEIIALRTAGKRPADLVLVSLVGPLREANPVIVAKPERTYDWRFLVGLSVLAVVTTQTTGLARLVQTLEAAAPAMLAVWFADQQDGVNVLADGYRFQTKTGRRMAAGQRANYAGMGSTQPADECMRLIAGQVKARAMANVHRFDGALVEMATQGFRHTFGQAWEVRA